MFTLTINQTDSRRDGDRVPQLLKDLRHIPARLDFDRSVEDEVQGILDCPRQTVEAALVALRTGAWYVGIGVGPVNEPLPNQIKDASGHGLVYDRSAAEWRVLDLLTPGVRGQQKAVAEEVGITTQAVNKAVAREQ